MPSPRAPFPNRLQIGPPLPTRCEHPSLWRRVFASGPKLADVRPPPDTLLSYEPQAAADQQRPRYLAAPASITNQLLPLRLGASDPSPQRRGLLRSRFARERLQCGNAEAIISSTLSLEVVQRPGAGHNAGSSQVGLLPSLATSCRYAEACLVGGLNGKGGRIPLHNSWRCQEGDQLQWMKMIAPGE